MAVLTDAKRAECYQEYLDGIQSRREPMANISTPDLRAGLDAVDVFIDNEKANYNNSLPGESLGSLE